MIKFVYLQVGKPEYQTELRYSVSTLLAEVPEAANNIVIYTDRPSMFAADGYVTARDISPLMEGMTNGGKYFYRAKPCVLLDALRSFDCPCVFLDTDTFVKRGFARVLKKALKRGAVMDEHERGNPYPECAGFVTSLPSGITYRYDPQTAVMHNSGVIGVSPCHMPAVEDSVALIDALLADPKIRRKTQEQFAISEALRLHGVRVSFISRVLKHYHAKSQKRYMHWRFQKDAGIVPLPIVPQRPRIMVNKPIGWCFKQATKYSLTRGMLQPAVQA